jgi:transcriptional regulator with XRE-family HTH domain
MDLQMAELTDFLDSYHSRLARTREEIEDPSTYALYDRFRHEVDRITNICVRRYGSVCVERITKHAGISQKRMATLLGVSQAKITQIKNGSASQDLWRSLENLFGDVLYEHPPIVFPSPLDRRATTMMALMTAVQRATGKPPERPIDREVYECVRLVHPDRGWWEACQEEDMLRLHGIKDQVLKQVAQLHTEHSSCILPGVELIRHRRIVTLEDLMEAVVTWGPCYSHCVDTLVLH